MSPFVLRRGQMEDSILASPSLHFTRPSAVLCFLEGGDQAGEANSSLGQLCVVNIVLNMSLSTEFKMILTMTKIKFASRIIPSRDEFGMMTSPRSLSQTESNNLFPPICSHILVCCFPFFSTLPVPGLSVTTTVCLGVFAAY